METAMLRKVRRSPEENTIMGASSGVVATQMDASDGAAEEWQSGLMRVRREKRVPRWEKAWVRPLL